MSNSEPANGPGSSAPSAPLTFQDLNELPVEVLRGVGEKRKADLEKIGITSLFELLTTYPRRWVDRTNECRLSDLVPGVEAMVLVEVRSVNKRMTKNRKSIVTAVVGDGSGRLTLTFFNQPYREKQLREGITISVFGKADEYRGALQMTNPVVDLIGDRTGRIVPIYPQSGEHGIKTWEFASWIENTLARCSARGIFDPLPKGMVEELGLLGRDEALRNIHLPDTLVTKERARRRLAFDELLRVQLILVGRKHRLERESLSIRHSQSGNLVTKFLQALPFPLTKAQERVIGEIRTDMGAGHPMHRLLQGDVGSGKTVVAVAALLTAVEGGYQGALMAPTEVLAEQHAVGVRALLDGFTVDDPANLFGSRPLRVELLTGRIGGEQRRDILSGLDDGTIDIAIGTHALIQDAVNFRQLGAVVVDEQHRFGVEQRAALRGKSKADHGDASSVVPDVLVMTATPIPRTAALTVYGDLDVSVLDELPPGRTPIATQWVSGEAGVSAVWAAVREGVAEGHQAFIVCPLIDESEKVEAAAAEDTFAELSAGELRQCRIGLLHGRMSSADKETVMNAFRAHELDVLVATTVIEVGVDVPNATMMVILDANRFGIAQLHQLRGRVGRGKIASRCWLVTTPEEGALVVEPGPRVEAIVGSTNGFELAEIDLELRGAGTLMDADQSGGSDLKLASLRRDGDLIEMARDTAFRIIEDDPTLSKNVALRHEIGLLITASNEEFLARS